VRIADRIKGSLAAKLLLITAGVGIVMELLISAIESWQESRTAIADQQRDTKAAVMANIDTLALAVWSVDDRVLELTASSLIRGTSIFHIEVVDDGATVLKLDRPGPAPAADYAWELPILRPNSDQQIATLKMWESYDGVRAPLKRRAGVLVITELTKILATSVLLFFVAYLLVTRPLKMLARKVTSPDAAEQSGSIVISRPLRAGPDEIDALVDAINASNLARRRMAAEQRRLQLREANVGKLQALGQLAGGIAHDFNNILGAILGFAGLLKDDLSDRPEQRRFAQRILSASERGRELISQIRTFARAETTERKVVGLVRIVRDNGKLLAASLPKSTHLRFELINGELPVLGSEALLGQLVTNLCVNASEALDGRPGEIRVSVNRAASAELETLRRGMLSANERLIGEIGPSDEYSCLRVADTAGGISDAVMDRIFEPFFTTKGRQRGTGLGLSVVHGVIESHNGACHVISRLGEGSVFSVYLPLRTAPLGEATPFRRARETAGAEKILIVDDEPDIVDVLTIGLERLGYETVGATDPREALAAFEEDSSAFDVVVSDEVMPGMRGLELIRRLKAIRPDIKTVLCTGYGDTTHDEIDGPTGVDIFLLKPVDASTIASKLRQLMDTAAE